MGKGKREIEKPSKDWLEVVDEVISILARISQLIYYISRIFKG